jgi:hypothetical protein
VNSELRIVWKETAVAKLRYCPALFFRSS